MDNAQFDEACKNGNHVTATRLYKQGNVDISTSDAFMLSCINGHLNIAKWLHRLGVRKHEETLVWAYMYDKWHIVMWLITIDFDIHVRDDGVFRSSCLRGHLDLAKILYKRGANIHICNDHAFTWSCEYNKWDVAKWLYTLGCRDDEYNEKVFNLVRIDCIQTRFVSRWRANVNRRRAVINKLE